MRGGGGGCKGEARGVRGLNFGVVHVEELWWPREYYGTCANREVDRRYPNQMDELIGTIPFGL